MKYLSFLSVRLKFNLKVKFLRKNISQLQVNMHKLFFKYQVTQLHVYEQCACQIHHLLLFQIVADKQDATKYLRLPFLHLAVTIWFHKPMRVLRNGTKGAV